jgi:hypothetical protein
VNANPTAAPSKPTVEIEDSQRVFRAWVRHDGRRLLVTCEGPDFESTWIEAEWDEAKYDDDAEWENNDGMPPLPSLSGGFPPDEVDEAVREAAEEAFYG